MISTQTRNPFTGEVTKQFDNLTHEEIEQKLEKSWTSFKSYKKSDIETRIEIIQKLVILLESNKQKYADMITMEMGKPLKQAVMEIEKCMAYCNYYIDNVKTFMTSTEITSPADKSYVAYQPLGPLALFQPWNFPFWLVFKTAIPQLMVGNTMLVKNAPNTPQCGMELEKLFLEAGFEEGKQINDKI